jgi:hypothetical protein
LSAATFAAFDLGTAGLRFAPDSYISKSASGGLAALHTKRVGAFQQEVAHHVFIIVATARFSQTDRCRYRHKSTSSQ